MSKIENRKSLSYRMKKYENISHSTLIPKQPVIVRIDGRNFKKYTSQKWCTFPYSDILINCFQRTTLKVCEEFSCVYLAYHQSDEVSFLLKDYESKEQEMIFDGNIQKLVSLFASKFTAYFNLFIKEEVKDDIKIAEFDARVFNLPIHEVVNYFIYRQRDAVRNSISRYADSMFSSKQLYKKNSTEKIEMINKTKNSSFDSLPSHYKNGESFIKKEVEIFLKELSEEQIKYFVSEEKEIKDSIIRNKWTIDLNIPDFSIQKEYINSIVYRTKGRSDKANNDLNLEMNVL